MEFSLCGKLVGSRHNTESEATSTRYPGNDAQGEDALSTDSGAPQHCSSPSHNRALDQDIADNAQTTRLDVVQGHDPPDSSSTGEDGFPPLSTKSLQGWGLTLARSWDWAEDILGLGTKTWNNLDSEQNSCDHEARPSPKSVPVNSRTPCGRSSPAPSSPRAMVSLRQLEALPDLHLQLRLMENWVIHLADAMYPVPGLNCPLRSIFVPIALEGAKAPCNEPTAATAVFHLICSVSASHLAYRQVDGREDWPMIALTHQNLGLAYLRQNIMLKDPRQNVELLAALFMCLEIDVFPVSVSSWRVHMRAACQWISRIGLEYWSQSASASTLYQMFAAGVILLQPQLNDSEDDVDSCPTPRLLSDFPEHLYILDRIYGLRRSVLTAIHTANKVSRPGSNCRISERDVLLLEIETVLSVPEGSGSGSHDDELHELFIFHNQSIFCYGLLIYLKRALRNVPVLGVQSLVQKCLDHMESIGRLSQRRPSSPLLWPIIVTAFEAATTPLQTRMGLWFDHQEQITGLEVFPRAKALVNRIWVLRRKHSEHGTDRYPGCQEEINWQDYLKHIPYHDFPLI